MRLALVTQAYYPVLGGVTEHVWHLGQELQRRGHEVTIVTGAVKRLKIKGKNLPIDDRGLRTIRLGFQIPVMSNGASVAITVGWKLGRQLQRLEEQEKFDLIHIQSPLDPGLPIIASKTMRAPKVGTYHTYRDPGQALFDKIPVYFHSVIQDALDKLDANIAVSPAAESFVHRYFPDAKMTIIPNGIDVQRFSLDVEPIPLRQNDEFLILYVGRMDPRKGAKFLFAALPQLEAGIKNYRVVVVGTGWMRQYYDAYIPLRLRHRVQFVGYATPADLPRYYRAADVYCSPATGNESFGIVLLEAMACGTPVVASDIEGYRYVIEPGKEGLLVPPRSPAHLAKALIALADDKQLRNSMGQQGRLKAAKYAWPKIVDQVEEVYKQTLAKQ
jgi:phosphatidyl-myo-inositol alpha-mannosyltransferase